MAGWQPQMDGIRVNQQKVDNFGTKRGRKSSSTSPVSIERLMLWHNWRCFSGQSSTRNISQGGDSPRD
jgi:hypothetical protein